MDIVTFFFNFGIFCLKYDFYQSLKERDVTYICNNELNMQKDGYNYIEKALNLIKKDKDLKIKRDHIAILKKIYKIYSEDERGNLEKLIEVAHLIPDQKLSNLYILSALLNMTDAPSSILFNAFGFPDNYKNYAQEYPVIFYTICAEARLREGKIEKALEILNQAIASADTNRYRFFDEELDVLIVKTMHLYLHSENYEGGYQLLQKIYLKFPEVIYGASANHQIKLYEAIIFENQGLTHKVNELLKNPTLKMLFFSNILNKVCVLVLDNKYQEAYNNLVRLNDISTNKESVFISKYMNRLESLLTECGSANTDPKNTGSSPSEDSIHQINDEEEFNNALSSLSGRQIHDWFQKQKSQFFSNKKDDYSYLIGKAKGHSWVIGDKLYSIAGSDIFNSKEHLASLGNLSPEIKDKMLQKSCAEIYIIGINYYAAISPKISAVLSDELSKKFIKAMEGGMVKNSSNSAGIKMIGHNLIELKICGQGADQRLYTDHIYKNSALESLIVFDYSGNHAKLSSACSASNLKIVDVPCIYDDLIGLVGGDNISLLGDVPSVL